MSKIQRDETAVTSAEGARAADGRTTRTRSGGVSEIAPEDRLPKVVIDGEEFWRVEGDYLLDVDQLFVYTQQQAVLREAARLGEGSKIVRWSPGTALHTVFSETHSPTRRSTKKWSRTCRQRRGHGKKRAVSISSTGTTWTQAIRCGRPWQA
jgi:hypothetical protein